MTVSMRYRDQKAHHNKKFGLFLRYLFLVKLG
jgi:hypothetical protein